jgi:hypothetical protein
MDEINSEVQDFHKLHTSIIVCEWVSTYWALLKRTSFNLISKLREKLRRKPLSRSNSLIWNQKILFIWRNLGLGYEFVSHPRPMKSVAFMGRILLRIRFAHLFNSNHYNYLNATMYSLILKTYRNWSLLAREKYSS